MPIKRLIWKQEEKLHTPLQMVYGQNQVFPKVRMIDVISHADPCLTDAERDYLFKAHFDFLVTNEDFMPVMAYELDGAHHLFDKKQIERDKKKDTICQKVNFPLIRVPLNNIKHADDIPAFLAEVGLPDQTAVEIVADVIKANHEVLVNPSFSKFLTWLNKQDFAQPIRWRHKLCGLIKLVREKGLDGAIAYVQSEAEMLAAITKLYVKSGLSNDEWKNCGRHAFTAFADLWEERSEALNLSYEEYVKTDEFFMLQVYYSQILFRPNGGTIYENVVLAEEFLNNLVQTLTSLLNLMRNYPAVVNSFIEQVGDLAEGYSGEEEVNRRLQECTVHLKYVREVKSRSGLK